MYKTTHTFKWKSLIAPIFLLLVVAVGIVYVKRPTELRKKAAINGAELSMSPNSAKKAIGEGFPIGIVLSGGATDSVTAVELHFAYDPNLVNIKGFTVGKQLPVVLSPGASTTPGEYSITLGAQPNVPFRGADIIGTLNVNVISNLPASISFSKLTKVAALEKPANTLVAASGITINGAATSIMCGGIANIACPTGMICEIPDWRSRGGRTPDASGTCVPERRQIVCAACNGSTDMTCASGLTCQAIQQGGGGCTTDSNGNQLCYDPAIKWQCAPPNNPSVCKPTSTPTPTCTPLPLCATVGILGANGARMYCDINPRLGVVYCPQTPSPTPTPHNWCAGPNGASCAYDCNTCNSAGGCTRMKCVSQGTCTNNVCTPLPTPTPYTQTGCVRSGCSGEICGSEAAGGVVSACIYKPVYACYKNARCEKQSNGVCAFTQTTELQSCLNTYITPTPTPPTGCYYKQVQCFRAPCDPILVCPTITVTPTPTCIPQPSCPQALVMGQDGLMRCPVLDLIPGRRYCTITPTPTPVTPTTQTIDIRLKLAGVTDGSAAGAKVGIKFVKLGGETLQLSTALPITHVGNGIYKAVADISNPLPYGTKFRIKVKGEKHTSVEYCYQVGQTGPCKDTEYITMPNFTAQTYGFDLTGLPLPPGDVKVQDGKVNSSDFDKIKSLMSKLYTSLTAEDRLIGDLDYNGYINVRDIFLIRQTLETRYDE